uniref:Uncharacterized protein n=1 Tax=Arundo donax TaxID=35708 RepID=A0A0A8YT54_ARUDO
MERSLKATRLKTLFDCTTVNGQGKRAFANTLTPLQPRFLASEMLATKSGR